MKPDDLHSALAKDFGDEICRELVKDFLQIRMDHATSTLERASPGKFVEGFVQALQFAADGEYDAKPHVEKFLSKDIENKLSLPDGLRVIAPRVARAIYALRSKRSIAHKNQIDPNEPDLAQIHSSATWIMSEMLRHTSGLPMREAGRLIEQVQAPIHPIIEEIEGTVLVHADLPIRAEILVILHRAFPEYVSGASLLASIGSSEKRSISNRLGELRKSKKIFGDSARGHRLTQSGYSEASAIIAKELGDQE